MKKKYKILIKILLSLIVIAACLFLYNENKKEKFYSFVNQSLITHKKDIKDNDITMCRTKFKISKKEKGFNNQEIEKPLLICFKSNKNISVAIENNYPNFDSDKFSKLLHTNIDESVEYKTEYDNRIDYLSKDLNKNHPFGTFNYYRNMLKGNIIDIESSDEQSEDSIKKIEMYDFQTGQMGHGTMKSSGKFYAQLYNGKTASGTFELIGNYSDAAYDGL